MSGSPAICAGSTGCRRNACGSAVAGRDGIGARSMREGAAGMLTLQSNAQEIIETCRMRVADFRGRGAYAEYANDRRCLFIHIPKTAGTSVSKALFGDVHSHHFSYRVYQRANPRKFQQFFKFTFVRNPYDRLVSAYFHVLREGANWSGIAVGQWWRRAVQPHPDFASFVRSLSGFDLMRCSMHFWPQSHFICRQDGCIMVDFIGRYENIEEDFNTVARRLGMAAPLPRANRSAHAHYSTYYDPNLQEIAAKLYAQDFQNLGYGFEITAPSGT
jgi:chondroitin 4-sulfotransferase 11